MKSDEITVLMPVYGEAKYINVAIQSVLDQSHPCVSLLIILDRAKQITQNIVREYEAKHSSIRVIESSEPGISNALNLGIQNSSTSLIARLDSDDLMECSRLELQKLEFEKNPKLVCIGSQMAIIDENGKSIGITKYPSTPYRISRSLRVKNVMGHPSVMLKKNVVEAVGGYRPQFDGAEDYDLWIRISALGEILNLQTALTKYRRHSEQFSSKNKERQLKIENEIRNVNYANWYFATARYCARNINSAISTVGCDRAIGALKAMLSNPKMFLQFILFQVIPRIKSK
jgi:glycosyltransferase involved in cell wall biosynthesis